MANAFEEINMLVKNAASFNPGGTAVIMDKGESPWHVAKAWNKKHPDRKITAQGVVSANPGVAQNRFMPGKVYKMPNAPKNTGAVRVPGAPEPGPLSEGFNNLITEIIRQSLQRGIIKKEQLPEGHPLRGGSSTNAVQSVRQ